MADETVHTQIRVLLADDHTVVRQGIARILQEEADMEVVGEVSDGALAIREAERLHPDVIVMDIGMPGVSGIEAAKAITKSAPALRILMLTVYDRDDFLFRALEAGASGYILKGAAIDELLAAIRTVHAGETYIHPRMATKLVGDYLSRLEGGEGQDAYARLSTREREVLPLLAEDRTTQEIGDILHVSPYTVQTYRQRIMQKLDLHSKTELLRYALRRGLIPLEEP